MSAQRRFELVEQPQQIPGLDRRHQIREMVLRDESLRLDTRGFFAMMHSRCNGKMELWWGQERLCEEAAVGRTKLWKMLRELQKANYVRIGRWEKNRSVNLYRLGLFKPAPEQLNMFAGANTKHVHGSEHVARASLLNPSKTLNTVSRGSGRDSEALRTPQQKPRTVPPNPPAQHPEAPPKPTAELGPVDRSFEELMVAAAELWGSIADDRIARTQAIWYQRTITERLGTIKFLRDAKDLGANPRYVRHLPELITGGYWREQINLPTPSRQEEKANKALKLMKALNGKL